MPYPLLRLIKNSDVSTALPRWAAERRDRGGRRLCGGPGASEAHPGSECVVLLLPALRSIHPSNYPERDFLSVKSPSAISVASFCLHTE